MFRMILVIIKYIGYVMVSFKEDFNKLFPSGYKYDGYCKFIRDIYTEGAIKSKYTPIESILLNDIWMRELEKRGRSTYMVAFYTMTDDEEFLDSEWNSIKHTITWEEWVEQKKLLYLSRWSKLAEGDKLKIIISHLWYWFQPIPSDHHGNQPSLDELVDYTDEIWNEIEDAIIENVSVIDKN